LPAVFHFHLNLIDFEKVIAFSLFSLAGLGWRRTAQSQDKDRYRRVTGEIDSLLYGNFTEHLGRCIYGGIMNHLRRRRTALVS